MRYFNELFTSFSNYLSVEIDHISRREPVNLYQPIAYSLQIGGKRIRPVLLLMAFNIYNDNLELALPAALAIEVFHNFTLLHDDIMDNAMLRRNNHAVHAKYSTNAAILSGDAMSILAYEYISKCQSQNYRQIIQQFSKTALEICEGQQYDMDFEKNLDVSVDDYLKMIGLKTAVLLATSMKIGGMIADAPLADCELLYQTGFNLGMAFQLQDDYLDTFGEQDTFGKKIGGDIVANKKTYLMLKALEIADNDRYKELKKLHELKEFDEAEKIGRVKQIYSGLNVKDLLNDKVNEFFILAEQNLQNLKVPSQKKEGLKEIAYKLMKRKN
ncbi:MAG: polyprenyl synthetase family protein [Prolixibacteraceae bacterium]|nr:polyprenyl synthetase family protein [Prolixibacteraceae bacterium]